MVYTKKEDGSWSVYARHTIKEGESVYTLKPFLSLSKPTRTSIQVREGLHVEDEVGQYINHSFQPTCKIDGFTVRALRDVMFGEEITFDYTLNESFISSPFVCKDTATPVGIVTEGESE
tara:strand:+ start:413 stop:769 length:357 start_codon:yes stop_codon:yes gene_type:complete